MTDIRHIDETRHIDIDMNLKYARKVSFKIVKDSWNTGSSHSG